MRKYYYSVGGVRKGPVSLVELKSLSEVTPETLVWYEGLPTWIRVGDLANQHEVVSIPVPSAKPDEENNTDLVIAIVTLVIVAITLTVIVLSQ